MGGFELFNLLKDVILQLVLKVLRDIGVSNIVFIPGTWVEFSTVNGTDQLGLNLSFLK